MRAHHCDPAADKQLMRETGRRLAEAYLKDRPLMTFEAAAMAEEIKV